MNFIELLKKLEMRLGYHQIPLNPSARGLKDLFEGSPLHHELIVRLAHAVFSHNRCRLLTDPVNRHPTFEAFAPLRTQVLQARNTDVDVYRLMDELCVALEKAFGTGRTAAVPLPRKSAEIIPLDAVRRQRRLKTWA